MSAKLTKRIVLLSTNADLAGAPLHVQALATGLSDGGYEVHVIFGEDGPVRHALQAHGLQTYVVPTMRSNFNALEDVQSFYSFRKLLASIRPHIVHTHSAKASLIGRLAASSLSIACVYTVHSWGFGVGRKKLASAIVRFTERCMRRLTAHYIFVARSESLVGMQQLGIAAQHLTVVSNGIADTPYRAQPSSSRVVTMVARDEFPKDYATFFAACKALNCEVWCVGKHTDSDAFRQKYDVNNWPPNAKLQRFGARADVDFLLAQSGIFVLSSQFEGLPLSILEAMRAGLPVIASDVGGIAELVQPNTGCLVPAGDSKALGAAIINLLNDDAQRAQFGQAGRRDYERLYSVREMVRNTCGIYESISRGE